MRESLSARADNEDAPVSARQVESHLLGCVACRRWAQVVHGVNRRVRLGDALPGPDLTARLVDAVEADARRRRSRRQWAIVALLVAFSGLVQLAVSIPLLAARGPVWRGGSVVVLESVVAISFLAGALILLWHYRRHAEPLDVVGDQPVVAGQNSNSRPGEVA